MEKVRHRKDLQGDLAVAAYLVDKGLLRLLAQCIGSLPSGVILSPPPFMLNPQLHVSVVPRSCIERPGIG